MADARSNGRSAAYLDWVQMLTGLGLVLFMWCHTILVSSGLLGDRAMDAIAGFFESTGMAQVGGPLIGGVFLLHFYIAARKIPFRTKEQGAMIRHSIMLHHSDTWLWVIQAVSAMIILILGSIHIWTALTNLPITAAKSAARFEKLPWLVFYLVLMPLVQLHVGIGLYRIGVKWGFITRGNRRHWKKVIAAIMGSLVLISILTIFLAH